MEVNRVAGGVDRRRRERVQVRRHFGAVRKSSERRTDRWSLIPSNRAHEEGVQ